MGVGRFAVVVAALFGTGTLGVHAASGQSAPARFVTVDQGGDELRADGVLAARLGATLIGNPEQLSYDVVINTLLDDARPDKPQARAGGVVARVTPYAFVVAEMRGAKVELLATCRSRSTGRTVTNAFVVVPQSSFSGPAYTTKRWRMTSVWLAAMVQSPARDRAVPTPS